MGAALALAAVGITLLSPLSGWAFASPDSRSLDRPSTATAEASAHAASANAEKALGSDRHTDSRFPPQHLHFTQGPTEGAISSADTSDASPESSAGAPRPTMAALRPVGTIGHAAAADLQRFASKASRTRGQPVTG